MSLAYADEAVRIKRLAPLSDRDIAQATGAALSTVGAWLRRTNAPTGQRAARLVELSAIVEQATHVLDDDYVPVWLNKPVAALGADKPIELIARGEYRRVAELLAGLESPVFT